MMSHTLHSVATAPAALSAFLRGVERRAVVLAELQCGDQDTGETCLAAAMRAFGYQAAALPMADWPQRFWSLLAATPGLRQSAQGAEWLPLFAVLAQLQPMARMALLLRLAAGLEEPAAAAAMGIDLGHYQGALSDACPRDALGQPDVQAWRDLAEAIQQQVRNLSTERLVRMSRGREAAIEPPRQADVPATRTAAAPVEQARSRPGRQRRWLLLASAAVLALALAAAWYWTQWLGADEVVDRWADPEVLVEALPPSEPDRRYVAAEAASTHPDRALVEDPEALSLAAQADFLAWYAASIASELEPIALPGTAVEAGATEEAADAPR